ncbi:MAG: DUF222 domain-containing protein, partial [Microbacteriaceae bacterium]
MNQPLQPLENDVTSLRAVWDGALPAFGPAGADTASQVASMSDSGLLATTDALAQLVRDAHAVLTRVAGEIARRSPSQLGKDGLAKQQGFQNPAHLVATLTGDSVLTAARLVSVGKATAPRQSLTGGVLPPTYPHVARAVAAGLISVTAASVITSMFERVKLRANPTQADVYEQFLARQAADLPHNLLVKAVREVEARLDEDGIAPHEEQLRAGRSLSMWEDPHGMLHLNARLDPETGAPVKAAIDSLVTKMIRARRTDADGTDNDNDGAGSRG